MRLLDEIETHLDDAYSLLFQLPPTPKRLRVLRLVYEALELVEEIDYDNAE